MLREERKRERDDENELSVFVPKDITRKMPILQRDT